MRGQQYQNKKASFNLFFSICSIAHIFIIFPLSVRIYTIDSSLKTTPPKSFPLKKYSGFVILNFNLGSMQKRNSQEIFKIQCLIVL